MIYTSFLNDIFSRKKNSLAQQVFNYRDSWQFRNKTTETMIKQDTQRCLLFSNELVDYFRLKIVIVESKSRENKKPLENSMHMFQNVN